MLYNWLSPNFVPLLITYSLAFIALLIGSITDLKTREVPDWVNYGLILSGLAINLLFTAIYSNPTFIINSIIGLAIFFGIAYIMFYAGQWGGGDSKMLMGIGAVIGIDIGFLGNQFLSSFLINALFAGAIYGLFWSLLMVFINRKKFLLELGKKLSEKNTARAKKFILIIMIFMAILFFLIKPGYIKIIILSVMLLTLATFYLWIFVKAIEKSSMHRLVEPSKLTEGDWIVKDVNVNGQYICGPKDLGISKSQIRKLVEFYKKRKVKKILIKEGIPFVPSFFVAFAVTLVFGNVLMLIV